MHLLLLIAAPALRLAPLAASPTARLGAPCMVARRRYVDGPMTAGRAAILDIKEAAYANPKTTYQDGGYNSGQQLYGPWRGDYRSGYSDYDRSRNYGYNYYDRGISYDDSGPYGYDNYYRGLGSGHYDRGSSFEYDYDHREPYSYRDYDYRRGWDSSYYDRYPSRGRIGARGRRPFFSNRYYSYRGRGNLYDSYYDDGYYDRPSYDYGRRGGRYEYDDYDDDWW